MAKHIHFQGHFYSRVKNVRWDVLLYVESDTLPTDVGELTFDGESPLLFEWGEQSKEVPLRPSTATIRLLSPSDRTYQHLYTTQVGGVMVEVKRNSKRYWMGALDPELYEEPYERVKDYPVSLTFSDFGHLDRLAFTLNGVRSLEELLRNALQAVGLENIPIDATHISTLFKAATTQSDGSTLPAIPMRLQDIGIRADNFYDEDGVPMKWREVVEGALQPLGLTMMQRGGKVYLYDLNGLRTRASQERIYWTSDAQTLGVDKVVNEARITFSPYTNATLLSGNIVYGGKTGIDAAKAGAGVPLFPNQERTALVEKYGDFEVFDRRSSPPLWAEREEQDFILFLSSQGKGLAYMDASCRYFKMLPLGGSSSDEGVAWAVPSQRLMSIYHSERLGRWLNENPRYRNGADRPILRSHRVYLPSGSDKENHLLRLSMDMLLDVRYNPFADTALLTPAESDLHNRVKVRTGWVFVPFSLVLYDDAGTPIMHYTNRATAMAANAPRYGEVLGEWVSGAPSGEGEAWLAYYPEGDPREETGILGWQTNRPMIGRPDIGERLSTVQGLKHYHLNNEHRQFDFAKRLGKGQPIPYPPTAGWIEVTVHEGVKCYDYGEQGRGNLTTSFNYYEWWDKNSLYNEVAWLLYKAPKVEVIRGYGDFEPAELDDVELSAKLNPTAAEALEIKTLCGVHPIGSPAARGAYLDLRRQPRTTATLRTLNRASQEGAPEQLLLNTLFSQFAHRHVRLTGESRTSEKGLTLFTEACQGDKLFLQSAMTEDAYTDTTDAVFVELSPEVFAPRSLNFNF